MPTTHPCRQDAESSPVLEFGQCKPSPIRCLKELPHRQRPWWALGALGYFATFPVFVRSGATRALLLPGWNRWFSTPLAFCHWVGTTGPPPLLHLQKGRR